MKTKLQLLAVFVIAAVAALFAQGPLTPPGAPAPTMKTLAQIEARTPISSAPFTITNSGSYYLTTNISVTSGTAITISASGVTLDLNGFTISSTEATPAGTGILLGSGSGVQDIRIFNGHIKGSVAYVAPNYTGPGFLNGIAWTGSTPLNVRVTDLTVSGCGLQGIDLGTDYSSTAADRCNVRTVGGSGIIAGSVNECMAYLCGAHGLVCITVANSTGRSTGFGRGIYADTAVNCYGDSLSDTGVEALFTASHCYGASSGYGDGVRAKNVQNCYGVSSASGHGVYADTVQNSFGLSSGSGGGVTAYVAYNCRGQSTTGHGVFFSYIGAMCHGTRLNPYGTNYVLGGGSADHVYLP